MDEGRIDKLAKHLANIQSKTAVEHRPRLPKTRTRRDLATVMLAVRDAVERFCLETRRMARTQGKGRRSSAPSERMLADTCTDTNVMSLTKARREGYENKIDSRNSIGIGGCHSSSTFRTLGTVTMPFEFQDVAKVTHSMDVTWQVADTHDKCLLNTSGIARDLGWWFMHGATKDGREASFALTQDDVVVPLDRDERGMPIFRTEGAPYSMASDPLRVLGDIGRRLINVESKYARRNGSTRKTAQAYAAEALLRDDTDDSESMSDDVPDSDASSDESESADLFDAITDVVGQAYATEGGMAHGSARKPRTLMPVHTPASWHNLLHAGKRASDETARTSDARFEIDGKVKLGTELNDKDLDALERARKECDVCKQSKMRASHARAKKGSAHINENGAHHGAGTDRGRQF